MALYWELGKKAKNERSEPLLGPRGPESNRPIVIILIFLRYHLLMSLGVHRAGPDR